jgi:Xaa-Pro dipeptidase
VSTDLFSHLQPMIHDIAPITVEERLGRVEKARRLMAQHGMDALFLEAGTGLYYLTGIQWWRSERTCGAVIPARGEIAYVCPAFEEGRFREQLSFGDDVRPWQEDESPYRVVAQILRDRGAANGRVGVEESVRFFIYDGVRRQAPHVEWVSGDPITIPCRAHKSTAEIALMQRANDITVAAYVACLPLLREGMSVPEFQALSAQAYQKLGAQGSIFPQFGAGTVSPHGSKEPQFLKEGDVVLMDSVCTVEGYHSDISRTVVYGQATQRQRDVWALEQAAQAAAFAAAQVGVPCEEVDAAARKVITDAGFGPDYRLPGLPHRTGHGIGLDVHEWYNLVRGEKTPIASGMCFTDEPMIAIPGEFGVRIEDCIYITEDGPRFFSQPSPSIEQPFA